MGTKNEKDGGQMSNGQQVWILKEKKFSSLQLSWGIQPSSFSNAYLNFLN